MVLAEYANHETTSFIAQLVSISCVVWVCYNIVFGIKNPEKSAPVISDNFQLGYIDSPQSSTVVTAQIQEVDELQKLKRQVEMAKLKKQLAELEQDDDVDNALLKDCVDTLVSLGTPKRKATAEAKQILQSSNIKTVQEFITEYGKR